jgi:hypothetical protein
LYIPISNQQSAIINKMGGGVDISSLSGRRRLQHFSQRWRDRRCFLKPIFNDNDDQSKKRRST